jgi:hypothetical protein
LAPSADDVRRFRAQLSANELTTAHSVQNTLKKTDGPLAWPLIVPDGQMVELVKLFDHCKVRRHLQG